MSDGGGSHNSYMASIQNMMSGDPSAAQHHLCGVLPPLGYQNPFDLTCISPNWLKQPLQLWACLAPTGNKGLFAAIMAAIKKHSQLGVSQTSCGEFAEFNTAGISSLPVGRSGGNDVTDMSLG